MFSLSSLLMLVLGVSTATGQLNSSSTSPATTTSFSSPPPLDCSNPISLTENELPPFISLSDTGFEGVDLLTVSVLSPLVDGRDDTSSSFSFEPHGSINAVDEIACVPTVAWSRSVLNNTCHERWTAVYAWTAIRDSCGFEHLDGVLNNGRDVFTGTLRATQRDVLATIRGVPQYRNTITDLEFKLSFESTKQLLAKVRPPVVYAPILVLSAVREARWNRLEKTLTLSVYNSVQYPFSLAVPHNASVDFTTGGPSAGYDSLDYDTDTQVDCPAGNGTSKPPCQRTVKLQLVPSASTCVLDGYYAFRMMISCSTSGLPSEYCPLNTNETYEAEIILYLETGNLCGSVDLITDESSLSLDLTTHRSDRFLLPEHKGFFQSERIYVKAAMSSNRVTISSTTLRRVVIDGIVLLDVAFPDNVNPNASFTQIPSGRNAFQHFSFVSDPSVFPVPQDNMRVLPVEVTVRATFRPSGLGKREQTHHRDITMHLRQIGSSEVDKAADTYVTIATVLDGSLDDSSLSASSDISQPVSSSLSSEMSSQPSSPQTSQSSQVSSPSSSSSSSSSTPSSDEKVVSLPTFPMEPYLEFVPIVVMVVASIAASVCCCCFFMLVCVAWRRRRSRHDERKRISVRLTVSPRGSENSNNEPTPKVSMDAEQTAQFKARLEKAIATSAKEVLISV